VIGVTANVAGVDEPHVLLEVTVTFPLAAVGVVEMEVVVEVPPAHPVGTVQVYDVEFVTAAML
jgi:hypothetical protein